MIEKIKFQPAFLIYVKTKDKFNTYRSSFIRTPVDFQLTKSKYNPPILKQKHAF